MLETKYVGDQFGMLLTILVTNNCYDYLFSFVHDRIVRPISGKFIQKRGFSI